MGYKLYIIGIGPGDKDYIYPAANKLIEASDVLIGGRRNLDLFLHLKKEEVVISNKLADIERYILEHIGKKRMVVLVSGDPGVFSIAEYLRSRLVAVELLVYPGISSMQYLCAKVNKNWNDVFIASLHGRELHNLTDLVKKHAKVMLFTGGTSSPDQICRKLAANGLGEVIVTIGEKLSYPEERIVTGSAEEVAKMHFDNLSVMLVEHPGQGLVPQQFWEMASPGIPDELFVRGTVPITKEEVRTVTLAKLRLRENSVVYDIGAGTGSVAIECGLIVKKGRVYAIEKEPDALALIRENVLKFGSGNVTVVPGQAPEILLELPKPDRIFIGGTGGKMDSILDWAAEMSQNIRIVVNAVAIETAYEALAGLENRGFRDVDITCVSVAKGRLAGKKHLMQALNPIYIISAEK